MTIIIAEAGVNHNGDERLAFELVDIASDAGADYIKFQTFKADKLVTSDAEQANYQKINLKKSQTQLEMLKGLELKHEFFRDLKRYCESKNIGFLSTAFDSESLSFLVNDLKLSTLKIASGEITNAPFLLEHAIAGKDIILSTGMSDIKEIELALAILAYGFIEKELQIKPSITAFNKAFKSQVGQKALHERVSLLHCTSEYPAPFNEVNLDSISHLSNTFNLPVGYSDHTEGISIPIAATALGCHIIEKHFTISRDLEGPDHKLSLEPAELKKMIVEIRNIEKAIGNYIKSPTLSELNNLKAVRKSIFASKDIKKGEQLTKDNICIKRPASGIQPIHFWDVIGSYANQSFRAGDKITID